MRRGAISTIFFGLACIVTAGLSAQILGLGMWSAIFLVAGIIVAISPYFDPIRELTRVIGLVAAILAFLAVALGLLAATIGGSFRLPADQALLLAAIGFIGVFGVAVYKTLRSRQDATAKFK